MDKILFITPPYHCGVVEVAGRWAPLTFAYLATEAKRAGFEPIIYDAMTKRHSHDDIQKEIESLRPAVVATTAITSTVVDALEILKRAKEVDPTIVTIIGGVHPSFMYKEVLRSPYVDYVVRGEGEHTLRELLVCISENGPVDMVKGIAYRVGHRVVSTPSRPLEENIDSFKPSWDLIDWKDYRYFVIPGGRLGAVSTSRGCDHSCTFCSQQKFWQRRWRARSPEAVVAEIEHLRNAYGVNVILITDEYPTADRQRWERILDLLIERDLDLYLLMETRAEDILRDEDILEKYRRAGVVHIYIGLEATDQSVLDMIHKDIKVEQGIKALSLIHQHGMITETSFILGFPEETRESIKRTLELSKIYNPDFAHYLTLAPWPYADIYKEMEPYIQVKDYRKYNLIDPVIKPENMSLEELDRAVVECYQSFYMGKLKEVLTMEDQFKKKYILSSMKLIMNSSFIVEKFGRLGRIPAQVESILRTIDGGPKPLSETCSEKFHVLARGSVHIDMPAEKVFSYISEPSNWPSFIPGLKEVIPETQISQGMQFNWTYRIRGIDLKGTGRVVTYEPGYKLKLQMHSLMPIGKEITLEPTDNGGTLLMVEVGYQNPGRVMSFLFNVIRKVLNVMETRAVLSRIKTNLEGPQTKEKAVSE